MTVSMIRCPFCTKGYIRAKPGDANCLECNAGFKIDDRAECVFVDLADPRLPNKGTFCTSCGLVQSHYKKRCSNCRTIIRHEVL
jgi:hypothetical protein